MLATKAHRRMIFAFLLSPLLCSHALGQQDAPAAERNLVASLLEEALAAEVKGKKFEEKAAERHREVIKNPIKDIVTYWRSEVVVKGEFVEPDKQLKVQVPKMVRAGDTITLEVTAAAPVKGEVSGKALTDNGQQLVAASSPFTATVAVEATCVITRVVAKDEVTFKVEVKAWKPVVKDAKFQNGLVDKLRGPIQKAANDKLGAAAEPLRAAANAALKKASDAGKLKFSQ